MGLCTYFYGGILRWCADFACKDGDVQRASCVGCELVDVFSRNLRLSWAWVRALVVFWVCSYSCTYFTGMHAYFTGSFTYFTGFFT